MWRQSIRTFSDETSIFGLHLFKNERTLVETLFWCTFVAVFGCYTAKSIVDIASKYLDEETQTVVYQKFQGEFYFPAPLICIYGVPALPDIQSRDMPTQAVLDEFLTSFDLNASNFLYAFNFLHDLHDLELSTIPEAYDSNLRSAFLEKIPGVVATLQKFVAPSPHLLTNISDFLFLKLCSALRLSLLVKRGNESQATDYKPFVCKREDIFVPRDSAPKEAAICIKLERKLFTFRSSIDYIEIKLRFNAATLRAEVGLDEQNTNVYVIADGYNLLSAGSSLDFDSYVDVMFHAHRIYYVRLNTVYEKLDLRRRRCDSNQARSAFCKSACESRFFRDLYGCWPSIFVGQPEENLTSIRRCEAIEYLTRLSSVARDSAATAKLEGCRRECIEQCSKPVFATNSEKAQPTETTSARIYVQSHVYTHIDERLANDFESFLSSLGGALGLWLGASFGSIVHIVVFSTQSVVGFLRSTKKIVIKKNAVAVEMAAASPESLEMRKILHDQAAQIADHASRLSALESKNVC